MSLYDDIIGQAYYDIVGRGGSDFNGQFNQPGGPLPNWGPVPGWGPNIGPMALAIGQETPAMQSAQWGPLGPAPQPPDLSAAMQAYGYGCPPGPVPAPGGEAPTPETGAFLASPVGGFPLGAPWGGFPWGGYGGWGYAPGVVPNGNFVASLLAAKHSKLVAPRAPTRSRREFLGFDPVCIGPCQTVTVHSSPQVLFRPTRLIIPSDIAYDLLIHEIKFGKWPLSANGGALPGAAFIENSSDNLEFLGETVQASCKISVTIENTSNHKIPLRLMFVGDAIE